MHSRQFESSTLAVSPHRRALFALGGVGLASTLGKPFGAAAKAKTSGKRRKNKKKCKDTCKPQVGQCILATTLICEQTPDADACKGKFLPCCDHLAACNVAAMLTCQNT